jgi:hypothetical protein
MALRFSKPTTCFDNSIAHLLILLELSLFPKNIIQRLTGWDPDCVCFKIMLKLVCAHNYRVTKFLHLRIGSLGPREHLQNKIHQDLLLCCFAALDYFFLGH